MILLRRLNLSRGVIDMIAAAFLLSIMAALVKAGGRRLPPQEMVLGRSLVVFFLAAILIRRKGLPLRGRNIKVLLLRGFFGFFGLSAFFYTLTHMPIADSVTLQYTSPLFTALLAQPLLNENSSARHWRYFLLAFAGIVLIIRPGFSMQMLPAGVGLGGAFFAGLAYNTVRKLRETDHPLNIVLYLPAVSAVLSAPLVAADFVMPRGWDWPLIVAVGILALLAQLLLTRSLHRETAARATNVSYIGVVFSTMWGVLLFWEIPDWRSLLGAAVVIWAIIRIAKK